MGNTRSMEDEPLAAALAQHHQGIEHAFLALVLRGRTGDPKVFRSAWTCLERKLLTHLEIEERELLPAFEQGHVDEGLALRGDHREIQETLCTLGLALDRHRVTPDALWTFCSSLREHARREERGLYPWLGRHLPHHQWRTLAHNMSPTTIRVRFS